MGLGNGLRLEGGIDISMVEISCEFRFKLKAVLRSWVKMCFCGWQIETIPNTLGNLRSSWFEQRQRVVVPERINTVKGL